MTEVPQSLHLGNSTAPELLGHGSELCIGIGVVNEQRINRTEEL
jgi:hypothetical protein